MSPDPINFIEWFNNSGYDYETFSKSRNAFHKRHPSVSIDEYRSNLLHKLGTIVSRRIVVYLDIKYWINIRDSLIRESIDSDYYKLYQFLKKAVKQGQIICPISMWVFVEFLKQTDITSRIKTCKIVDELSSGVSFVNPAELSILEFVHFFRKTIPSHNSSRSLPIKECIWTRITSFAGSSIPELKEFSHQDELLLQKSWEDLMFFMPLESVFSAISNLSIGHGKSLYNFSEMNERKKYTRQQNRSYEEAFLAELMHSFDEESDSFFKAVKHLFELENKIFQRNDSEYFIPDSEYQKAKSLIFAVFKKKKITTELPCLHIPASLYAFTTWDLLKKVSENDYFDIHHARFAVPYSDVFLTEKYLANACMSNLLRFDKIYETKIIINPNDALRIINELVVNRPINNKSILSQLFEVDLINNK